MFKTWSNQPQCILTSRLVFKFKFYVNNDILEILCLKIECLIKSSIANIEFLNELDNLLFISIGDLSIHFASQMIASIKLK